MTDNSDVVFICCKTQDDVNKFTSRARNIPQETGPNQPRLVMYVDRRASKRHKAIVKIAKTMREHAREPIQTSIRVGKNDFLLRQRPRGSETPWTEIPPLELSQELPDFEVGTYTDVIETLRIMQENQNQLEEQMEEELEEIVQDLSRQNEKNNKKTKKEKELMKYQHWKKINT